MSPENSPSVESTQDAQTALEAHILGVVAQAIARGAFTGAVPASVRLERPKNRDHGDYATSIALQLAKAAGIAPQEVAKIIAADLTALDSITSVDIAGPGFINITIAHGTVGALHANGAHVDVAHEHGHHEDGGDTMNHVGNLHGAALVNETGNEFVENQT